MRRLEIAEPLEHLLGCVGTVSQRKQTLIQRAAKLLALLHLGNLRLDHVVGYGKAHTSNVVLTHNFGLVGAKLVLLGQQRHLVLLAHRVGILAVGTLLARRRLRVGLGCGFGRTSDRPGFLGDLYDDGSRHLVVDVVVLKVVGFCRPYFEHTQNTEPP
jgi:hypothetical protein